VLMGGGGDKEELWVRVLLLPDLLFFFVGIAQRTSAIVTTSVELMYLFPSKSDDSHRASTLSLTRSQFAHLTNPNGNGTNGCPDPLPSRLQRY